MRWAAIVICMGLGVAGAARAAPVQTNLCQEGPAATTFGLGKIVGAPKVYLKTCTPGEAGCTEPAKPPYVIPGDVVIVGARSGDAVCVAKPNRLGDTAGWVAQHQVALQPSPPAPASAWVGHWVEGGGDAIDLTRKGGALVVSGTACWPACNTSGKLKYGPNVGEIDATGAPANGRLNVGSPDDCAADMWLVGPYLVVFDNLGCGGMNVSFTGVYEKVRGR